MPPKPLQLWRRRWTLVFSVPFTVFIALIGAYSVFLMFSEDRLVTLISAVGAFVAFCVGGTLGKSVLEAWRNTDPAVVVDQHGLNDLRSAIGQVPWHEIETVKLDVEEQRILVNFVNGAANNHRLASTARRLFAGADYTIALGGLSYSPHDLAKALAEHHRHGRLGSGDEPM